MKYILISFLMLLSSCSYSINQIHTEGTASDVVDDTLNQQPNISPNLNLPLGIP
ncbi:hypothetical protein UFOVP844_17 [uncultured Caudovirales phage]|uniref:Lipoprotein n=1 Tax=uncultured Caudovirales phage TaxID=2100421 RepID=A0A6J5PAJ0_9CAUD|nr:hypothetical protein UFOVP844_17 [uncultured Caudovirales phage]